MGLWCVFGFCTVLVPHPLLVELRAPAVAAWVWNQRKLHPECPAVIAPAAAGLQADLAMKRDPIVANEGWRLVLVRQPPLIRSGRVYVAHRVASIRLDVHVAGVKHWVGSVPAVVSGSRHFEC